MWRLACNGRKNIKFPYIMRETGTGLLRHLYFRKGQATGQVLACIVINGTDLPGGDALCAALRAAVPGLVGVVLNSNTRRTNVIFG